MRLFLAVDLDDPVRERVALDIDGLRRACDRAGRDLARAVKWVRSESLHLTLHFLGEVPDRRVPGLRAALASPLDTSPFEMVLGGLGMFPSAGPPRVVWMGVAEGATSLTAAHRELGARLERAGVDVERRPYAAHLTLGRVKAPVQGDLRGIVTGLALETSGASRVDHVTVYRSHLQPAGPRYEPVWRMAMTA